MHSNAKLLAAYLAVWQKEITWPILFFVPSCYCSLDHPWWTLCRFFFFFFTTYSNICLENSHLSQKHWHTHYSVNTSICYPLSMYLCVSCGVRSKFRQFSNLPWLLLPFLLLRSFFFFFFHVCVASRSAGDVQRACFPWFSPAHAQPPSSKITTGVMSHHFCQITSCIMRWTSHHICHILLVSSWSQVLLTLKGR